MLLRNGVRVHFPPGSGGNGVIGLCRSIRPGSIPVEAKISEKTSRGGRLRVETLDGTGEVDFILPTFPGEPALLKRPEEPDSKYMPHDSIELRVQEKIVTDRFGFFFRLFRLERQRRIFISERISLTFSTQENLEAANLFRDASEVFVASRTFEEKFGYRVEIHGAYLTSKKGTFTVQLVSYQGPFKPVWVGRFQYKVIDGEITIHEI